MTKAIAKQLSTWAKAEHIKAVLIYSNNDKAFCAGGDIRDLYSAGPSNPSYAHEYFWHEYRLNYQIALYPKPYIAIMNGIVMGGGAGISIHASLRIATDDLVFAMPETKIGFFPDIGGSYFLSRCPDYLGLYIGLTAEKINAADAKYAMLADAIINKNDIQNTIQIILNNLNGIDKLKSLLDCVSSTKSVLANYHRDIIKHFAKSSVAEILHSLSQDHSFFAQQTLKTLNTRSPTSLAITLAAINRATAQDLASCLKMEYYLMQQCIKGPDIYEGIRAAVIDKDNKPCWKPTHVSRVSDKMLHSFFDPTDKKELQLDI